MNVNELNIAEIDTEPPPLELSPEEMNELADALVAYQGQFAERYYSIEQAQWGEKYLKGLRLPIERKAIQPMALSLQGGQHPGYTTVYRPGSLGRRPAAGGTHLPPHSHPAHTFRFTIH